MTVQEDGKNLGNSSAKYFQLDKVEKALSLSNVSRETMEFLAELNRKSF